MSSDGFFDGIVESDNAKRVRRALNYDQYSYDANKVISFLKRKSENTQNN